MKAETMKYKLLEVKGYKFIQFYPRDHYYIHILQRNIENANMYAYTGCGLENITDVYNTYENGYIVRTETKKEKAYRPYIYGSDIFLIERINSNEIYIKKFTEVYDFKNEDFNKPNDYDLYKIKDGKVKESYWFYSYKNFWGCISKNCKKQDTINMLDESIIKDIYNDYINKNK